MNTVEQLSKTFVIDTNVLIHNPEAVMSFRDNEIVIPLWVLEELDHLKSYSDQRGKSAREAIRFIATATKNGNLHDGVKLENGSILRVVMTMSKDIPEGFLLDKNDNKIIMTAYALQQQGKRVFFVSKDINARVKAVSLGLRAVDYEKQKVDINTLYSGYRDSDVSADTFDTFERDRVIPWKDTLHPNEYAVLNDRVNSRTAIGRYDVASRVLNWITREIDPICGISALNERQRIAIDLLMDDTIPLVTLLGKAGTGKTLLAIAIGLKKVIEEKKYSRMLVSRPVVPVGKDIGYLPGEKTVKMSNWMEPLFDNLEYILGVYKRPSLKSMDQLIKDKTLEIEALSFIRGRSLPNQFIIIDEAQNLTPHEVKTIVSRAGENTKVVLTGDPYQIDNMYLDANSNGLTYLVDAFKGQTVFGHVILQKSERSTLAELATELL
jgi:PhoH-like ATPase